MGNYDAPKTGGEGVSPADLHGHLLVVEPIELVESVPTQYGDTDAIRVVCHDISAQETYEDCLWFAGVLVGGLKRQIGSKVLGVMAQGEPSNPKNSPPWILEDASGNPDLVAAADAYMDGVAKAKYAPAVIAEVGRVTVGDPTISPEIAAALKAFQK